MVRRKVDRSRLGIYCWFFCVVTVLSLAGVLSWLSLTPKQPHFRISNPYFPALDFKNNQTQQNASIPTNSIIFDLEIFNPNKRMGIYYSGISVKLYNGGGAVVGTKSTPGFYQGHKNTTLFQILIPARQEFWQAINGGNIDFTVRVKTAVVYRIIKWKTKQKHVACEQRFTDVKISLNGTISGGNYAEQQNASNVKEVRT